MRIGLPGLMFIVFLTLKLCHVIAWSWWWITAPLWGGFLILFVILFVDEVIEQINSSS